MILLLMTHEFSQNMALFVISNFINSNVLCFVVPLSARNVILVRSAHDETFLHDHVQDLLKLIHLYRVGG